MPDHDRLKIGSCSPRASSQERAHHGHVVVLQAAAERVGQQLLGERVDEDVRVRQQRLAQLARRRRPALPSVSCAARVDRRAGLARPPARRRRRSSPCAKPSGSIDPVAARARGIGPMRLHPLAHRPRRARRPRSRAAARSPAAAAAACRAGSRASTCRAASAPCGRRATSPSGCCPCRAGRGAPSARPSVDAAEVAAVDVRDAVVPRQPLVDERVVGRQQVERRCGPRRRMLREEQLGLAPEAPARRSLSKSGNSSEFGAMFSQVAQVQPLAGEVLDERVGLRIGEHAPHLRLEHCGLAAARPAAASVEQRVVRDAAPEEERQPRRASSRSLTRYAAPRRDASAGSCFDAEHERRARQQCGAAPAGCRFRSRRSAGRRR